MVILIGNISKNRNKSKSNKQKNKKQKQNKKINKQTKTTNQTNKQNMGFENYVKFSWNSMNIKLKARIGTL